MASIGIGIGVAKAATGGLSGTVTVSDPGTCYAGVATTVTVTASASITRVVLTEVGVGTVWDDSATPFSGPWTPSLSGSRTLIAYGYVGAALVATHELVVSVGTLIEGFADAGISGTGVEVWLDDRNVTLSGADVTHHLGVINGYDRTPLAGTITVDATGFSGKPAFVYDGVSGLCCTEAALLAPYSGDDRDTCMIFGFSCTGFTANKTLMAIANSGGAGARLDTSAASGLVYARVTPTVTWARSTSNCLGPGSVWGFNIGTTAQIIYNGVTGGGPSTVDGIAITVSQILFGGRWTGSAFDRGFVGKGGFAIVCNPNTVDRTKLLKLLVGLGYGAGGVGDMAQTSAWFTGDPVLNTIISPSTLTAAEQDVLSGSHALEGVAVMGDTTSPGTLANYQAFAGQFDLIALATGPTATFPPLIAVLGNHDREDAAWEANRAAVLTWEAGIRDANYCYTYLGAGGLIRWLHCNVSVVDQDVSAQAAFVTSTLAASTAPWNIVVWHYRPYRADTSGTTAVPSVLTLIQAIEDSGKDCLVICGHTHIWVRSYPMHDGVRDDTSKVRYLVAGRAGVGPSGEPAPTQTDVVTWGARTDTTDAANWCANVTQQSTDWGLGRMIATTATLWIGYYVITPSTGAGKTVTLLDSVSISKA